MPIPWQSSPSSLPISVNTTQAGWPPPSPRTPMAPLQHCLITKWAAQEPRPEWHRCGTHQALSSSHAGHHLNKPSSRNARCRSCVTHCLQAPWQVEFSNISQFASSFSANKTWREMDHVSDTELPLEQRQGITEISWTQSTPHAAHHVRKSIHT